MTTTDMSETAPAHDAATGGRRLRRSRTDRVGAGVAGGLGTYFAVDPVLFRVLFATSAFFGGTGVLAYLLAWAAIPEAGTERAPIDGWVGALRRRRIPPWIVAVVGGLVLWGVAFSWWAPGPIFPVLAIVVVLVVAFGRREWQGADAVRTAPAAGAGAAPTVDLRKEQPDTRVAGTSPTPTSPTWVQEARGWLEDAKDVRRARRRRAFPVKVATLGALVATLATFAVIDSVTGIWLQAYFWTGLGIVVAGLLLGAVLRRTPWSVVALLPLLLAGTVAFSGSHASLHDGAGDRTWAPTSTPDPQYRLAFGRGTLDLRGLPAQAAPTTVRVTAAAGEIRVVLPAGANVEVQANVHIGQIDRSTGRFSYAPDNTDAGVGVSRVLPAPDGAAGARITVVVHLADGRVQVVRP